MNAADYYEVLCSLQIVYFRSYMQLQQKLFFQFLLGIIFLSTFELSGQCTLEIDTIIHPTCGLDNGFVRVRFTNFDSTRLLWWQGGSTAMGGGFAQRGGLAQGRYLINATSENCPEQTLAVWAELVSTGEDAPVASLTNITDESCVGNADGIAFIDVEGGVGQYNYTWSNGSTLRNAVGLSAGEYSVIVEDEDNCKDTVENIIVQVPEPITIDSLEDTEIFLGGEKQLSPTVNGGEGVMLYDWTPKTGLSCGGECLNPRVKVNETTEYSLVITDANGCTAEGSVVITVLDEIPEIFVPSGFTPNGDGSNDVFQVYGQGIEYLTLTIFDRWGTMVHQITDQSQVWDGNLESGKPAPTGTYVYILEIEYLPEMGIPLPKPVSGNVTLLRN